MTVGFALRAPHENDRPWMHDLNQANTPEVGDVTPHEFAELLNRALFARVAVTESDNTGVGFIICLGPGGDYDSPNYRFFESQSRPHLYNDRIAIADGFRGRGLGRALYESSFAFARDHQLNRVTAEVNVQPPNPGSLAMHDRLGFRPIEDRTDPRNGKVVRMLERPL